MILMHDVLPKFNPIWNPSLTDVRLSKRMTYTASFLSYHEFHSGAIASTTIDTIAFIDHKMTASDVFTVLGVHSAVQVINLFNIVPNPKLHIIKLATPVAIDALNVGFKPAAVGNYSMGRMMIGQSWQSDAGINWGAVMLPAARISAVQTRAGQSYINPPVAQKRIKLSYRWATKSDVDNFMLHADRLRYEPALFDPKNDPLYQMYGVIESYSIRPLKTKKWSINMTIKEYL